VSIDDFHSGRTIKATRKQHVCEQCGRKIETGSPAHYAAGRFDGYFYTQHVHIECQAAATAYAELNGLWGEDFPWFQHADRDMRADFGPWLLDHHPIVAERLNIEREKDEVEA
jgi:hypothetical protein